MSEKPPLVPHIVAQQEESATRLTIVSVGVSVASIMPSNEEQMKFFIGLRILGKGGKEKLQRYLTYLQQLSRERNPPEGEALNDDL